jgi:acyl phosphate:glycerol-3-phosphate acyltransferase
MRWIEQLRTANWTQAIWIALGCYLLGCFTTGYYLVRVRTGHDLRALGSGSVGARNAGRLLGWPGFVLTVLGDFGKGALAVWAARRFAADERLVLVAMLAVVAGHVWPAQLLFRGGKGMATALGALLVYDWQSAIGFALVFAGAYALTRKTVLPGLFAMICLPFIAAWLGRGEGAIVALSALAALVVFAHRQNLLSEIAPHLSHRPVAPNPDSPEP